MYLKVELVLKEEIVEGIDVRLSARTSAIIRSAARREGVLVGQIAHDAINFYENVQNDLAKDKTLQVVIVDKNDNVKIRYSLPERLAS